MTLKISRTLAIHMIGTSALKSSTISGKSSNRNKKGEVNQIDPNKVLAIKGKLLLFVSLTISMIFS